MNKPMTMLRPQDHDEILRSALSVLADDFKHGELAFLALTSKPEGHFRDRLAYRLYMHFQQEPILVCREWRRIDLAVISLESDMPLLLLELKWMYSLNGCENKTEYFDRVIRDEEKALRAAAPTTSVYTLLLATHPKAPIPRGHFPIVKYAGEVNRSFSRIGSAEAIALQARAAASLRFGEHKVCGHGEIEGGEIYKVPVSVLWWLVRAELGQSRIETST